MMDAFSHGYGKVRVIAKGIKRPGNHAGGLLRPFQPLLLSWQGKGSLKNFVGVESEMRLPALTGDTLFSAFYINELLQLLLRPDDPAPALFIHYAHAMGQLASMSHLEITLRNFEWHLLCELGMAPDLIRDHLGAPLASDRYYVWGAEQGFMPAEPAARFPESMCFLASQLRAVHAFVIENAPRWSFDDADTAQSSGMEHGLPVAKRLFRQIIAHLLQGRPLRSRELMLQYRSFESRDADTRSTQEGKTNDS